MIDEKLTWEAQIDYLKEKLLSGILVIKRIKKFIPESEYMNLYSKNKLKSAFIHRNGVLDSYLVMNLIFIMLSITKPVSGQQPTSNIKPRKTFCYSTQNIIFNDRKLLSLHHKRFLNSKLQFQ